MKLLWVKSDFLHPTDRGGQIRTLEMIRRLHAWHQVDFIALTDGTQPEGPARAGEYSRRHYAIAHRAPDKRSAAFALQLMKGLVSPRPVSIDRWQSEAMRQRIAQLDAAEHYDAIVCDFLFSAPNLPDLKRAILFQHNVEAMIWQRHAEHGATPLHRAYFRMQHRRMKDYEGQVCRSVRRVIAVSEQDARTMENDYGISGVAPVPTGVDCDYFRPPEAAPRKTDLVFLGSMDWLPNIDGALWFTAEILPLIRREFPECTLALAGRSPTPALRELAARDPRLTVTGTLPDVRPWLHGASVSIVPLRIGGGTRLKIYESMAAGVPVVSTAVGAEGLDVASGETIRLADTPDAFAAACCRLLSDQAERQRIARQAMRMVADRYSWDAVTRIFEGYLQA